jgi:membrane protease YdiL (CAAX protease family)
VEESQPPLLPPAPRLVRFRWAIHLLVLGSYPLLLGAASFLASRNAGQPVIPEKPLPLLWMMSLELLMFAFVFGVAWLASRASADELFLKWKGGWRPLWRGFLYSIGLRLSIALVLLIVGVIATALLGSSDDLMKKLQPETEQLVSAKALTKDPIYLWLNLTFVSFVVAGLREEFWRAGMLAGLLALFPWRFNGTAGQIAAVGLVALVFGLGHLVQGWGGVMMTTLLGVGLGIIIIIHRSIWEAVLAHGFFDAASFGTLYFLARFFPDLLPGI